MKHKTLGSALLLASGLMFGATSAWAGGASPEMLANTCAGCHGTNGASVGPSTPTIAGLTKDTIVESMKAYKDDSRSSTIMGRIARGYTDEDFEAMGEFFAKQKFVPAQQEVDAEKAKAGAKLHDKYCEKCHSDNGATDDDGSSILAGQWMPYMTFSIEDFNSGAREMPKKMKKKMEKMVKKEGADSLDKVIHFYGSQK